MKRICLFFCPLLILLSCSRSHYIYLVRHAEKADNTPYSVLSQTGHQRAAVLRDSLLDKKIGMVFATPFQRTQETAQPLATAVSQPLVLYRNNAEDSIARAVKAITNRNILVVGHSGNLPAIIEKIAGQKIKPIGEHEYDNLYVIKTRKGQVELIAKKYGPASLK